tara:strand:+ start:10218 stop:10940 length:723 start_codon:yes stop_codon:yes gene_type:complete
MSLSNGAPAGWSGSPGDLGTCYNCHDVTPADFSASVNIFTDIPVSGYELSTSYNITVTINETGASKHGFALTAERDDNNSKVGTFIPTNSTKLVNDDGNIAQSNPDSGNTWSFTWVSPSNNEGNVTLYAAGNAVNGDSAPSGDQVVTTSLSLSPSLGISESRRLEFKMFPNPSIDNVNIQLPTGASEAEVRVFDYTGRKISEKKISSNDHLLEISSLGSGMYIISVLADNKVGVQTLIKK